MECRTVPFTALEITSADVVDAIGYGPHLPTKNVLQLISGLFPTFEKYPDSLLSGYFRWYGSFEKYRD